MGEVNAPVAYVELSKEEESVLLGKMSRLRQVPRQTRHESKNQVARYETVTIPIRSKNTHKVKVNAF